MIKLKVFIKKWKIHFFSLCFIVLGFLNFQFNFFKVVSSGRFNYFQVESEQFVLDGYLNHKLNNDDLKLGQFSRPSIDMFNEGEKYKPREWYENQFIEGRFWEYKSHFGLQKYIFSFFSGDLLLVQSISSFILTFVLLLLYRCLSKLYSFKFSAIVVIALFFSPWIVPIARNTYFFVGIYFIPLLLNTNYINNTSSSIFKLLILYISLFIAFLLKSLIGYDYLSTIVLVSLIPFIYSFSKNKISIFKIT